MAKLVTVLEEDRARVAGAGSRAVCAAYPSTCAVPRKCAARFGALPYWDQGL